MKTVEFCGYIICENGYVTNRQGKEVKHHFKRTRYEIRLVKDGKKKAYISARLIYCLFNDIDYDIFDNNICVTFDDGDPKNIHLNNLITMTRKELTSRSRTKESITEDKGYMVRLLSGEIEYIYPIISECIGDKFITLSDGFKTYEYKRNSVINLLEFE